MEYMTADTWAHRNGIQAAAAEECHEQPQSAAAEVSVLEELAAMAARRLALKPIVEREIAEFEARLTGLRRELKAIERDEPPSDVQSIRRPAVPRNRLANRAAATKSVPGAKATRKAAKPASPPASTPKTGRLARRSADEIGNLVDRVVALVQSNSEGLRAEQIRVELGLDAKQLPRILKQGLATNKLRSTGHKRATTYFAGEAE